MFVLVRQNWQSWTCPLTCLGGDNLTHKGDDAPFENSDGHNWVKIILCLRKRLLTIGFRIGKHGSADERQTIQSWGTKLDESIDGKVRWIGWIQAEIDAFITLEVTARTELHPCAWETGRTKKLLGYWMPSLDTAERTHKTTHNKCFLSYGPFNFSGCIWKVHNLQL